MNSQEPKMRLPLIIPQKPTRKPPKSQHEKLSLTRWSERGSAASPRLGVLRLTCSDSSLGTSQKRKFQEGWSLHIFLSCSPPGRKGREGVQGPQIRYQTMTHKFARGCSGRDDTGNPKITSSKSTLETAGGRC